MFVTRKMTPDPNVMIFFIRDFQRPRDFLADEVFSI